MIRILEEPVAYDKDEEDCLDNPDNWIYKNPTQKEIDSLIKKSQLRILTYENDFYLASGYYWIHCYMANALKNYTNLNYAEYDCYIINLNDDFISTGDVYDYGERYVVLQRLNRFIPELKRLGLVNDSTLIRYSTGEKKLSDFYRDN
jgi:hypothetical protein